MIDTERGSDLASLLCGLSFATGLAMGDRMEHGMGTAFIGLRLADALGLDAGEREAIYYGALLKDAGCTACGALLASLFPHSLYPPVSQARTLDAVKLGEVLHWLSSGVPFDTSALVRVARLLNSVAQCGPIVREAVTAHCEVAELVARRLGFGPHVQAAVRHQLSRWDGRGPAATAKGEALPVAARVLNLAQVVDLCHGFGGPGLARERVRSMHGTRFDPTVAAAFLAIAEAEGERFWQALVGDDLQAAVLAAAPPTSAELKTEEQIDAVCEALADLADSRTRARWNHSFEVADCAVAVGGRLGLSRAALRRVRRAALLHDLGILAVPLAIVSKAGPLLEDERDQLRLHSYYTQCVLERVPQLRDLAVEASANHEWVNGQGYHRRLAGEQIPLAGRILAVADLSSALRRESSSGPDPDEVMARLWERAGTQLDGSCCEALAAVQTGLPAERQRTPRPSFPEELSEREVEVLRLLTRGLSNPQIGAALFISKKTVEHHLQHIYAKLGISSRTSAVAYAIQRGLA